MQALHSKPYNKQKTLTQPSEKEPPDFYHSILRTFFQEDCFPIERTGTHVKNPCQYILVKTEVNFDVYT